MRCELIFQYNCYYLVNEGYKPDNGKIIFKQLIEAECIYHKIHSHK